MSRFNVFLTQLDVDFGFVANVANQTGSWNCIYTYDKWFILSDKKFLAINVVDGLIILLTRIIRVN